MGFEGFDWQNSNDVLEEGARFSRGSRKDFNMVKVAAHREGKTLHEKLGEFGTNGIQGPVLMLADGSLEETKRLHDVNRVLPADGPAGGTVFNKKLTHFNSQTGKCNLQKAPWSLFSSYWEWLKPRKARSGSPQGASMSAGSPAMTTVVARTSFSVGPKTGSSLHPDDAAGLRYRESGDYVMVFSDRVPVQKRHDRRCRGR